MNSEKALSLITAKTMSLEQGGFGGLNPADIALCLGGLAPGPYALAMSLYCDDFPSRKELLYRLRVAAAEEVQPITGKPYIRVLCEIAVAEMVGDWHCPDCQGRGFKYTSCETPEQAKQANEDGYLVTSCDQCNDGILRMTDAEKSHILSEVLDRKISARDYMHKHAFDVQAVLAIAQDWKSDADSHIMKRLNKPSE